MYLHVFVNKYVQKLSVQNVIYESAVTFLYQVKNRF